MTCWEDDDIDEDLDVVPLYRTGIPRIRGELIHRKPEAYKPHAISLGPLHFGESHLENYQKMKQQLLQDRFPYRVRYFDELVSSISGQDNLIRQWYRISDSETFQEPGKMMALDGIFLLEFLREISPIPADERAVNIAEIQGMAVREGFPNLKENVTRKFQEQLHALTNQEVQEDILKLQNQIPIFALEMIIEWEEKTYQSVKTMLQQKEGKEKDKMPQREERKEKDKMPQQEEHKEKETMLQDIMLQARRGTNQNLEIILGRALHKLSPFVVGEESLLWPHDNVNAHILGYVYENIGQWIDLTQYKGKGNQKKILPQRALGLHDRGVKFAAYTGPLHKIRFDRNTWTFHLPRIEIAERTDAVMRNFMAFELFGCEGQTKRIKRYVELMDQLIDTAADVEVLRNNGIINNHLGCDQAVADIWNKMREGHDQNGKYGPIDTAIDAVINFYGSYRIWFSEGVKKFFSTPWLVVSFIAGCIIVITAIVQTIFSGLQLHHH